MYPESRHIRTVCRVGRSIANRYAHILCFKSNTCLIQSLNPTTSLCFLRTIYEAMAGDIPPKNQGIYSQTCSFIVIPLIPSMMQSPQHIPMNTNVKKRCSKVFLLNVVSLPISIQGFPRLSCCNIKSRDLFILYYSEDDFKVQADSGSISLSIARKSESSRLMLEVCQSAVTNDKI